MPASCILAAEMPCAPQQSSNFRATTVPASATPPVENSVTALPHLVQLLVGEALRVKISATVLNRLSDRPSRHAFSEESVDILRSQLGAEQLSDLCALDVHQLTPLLGLAPDERESLAELCEKLQRDLEMSCCNLPLLPPAFCQPLQLQQTPSNQAPQVEQIRSIATPQLQRLNKAEEVPSCMPGQTKWPEHEAKHFAGECQPCAYYFKPDSCKWGSSCNFCHLCPDGEVKLRKKEKIRALREQALREKNERQASEVVSLSLSTVLNYL